MYKKISALCAVAACSTALVMTGSVAVYADDADESIVEYLNEVCGELTEEIVGLSDDDLADIKDSGTDFAVSAVEAWESARDELGEYKSVGDVEVEYDDDIYTATVPAEFETYDANFVYIFDETGNPTSMTVDVQYPLSVNMKRAALNTLMGLGTVFAVLVFLMFMISLFKYIPGNNTKKQGSAPAPAPVPVPVPAAEELTDDTELIAVIAAAIAASEGAANTDGFVVRSIRKVNRKTR
jgi:sodium pump decarboxylase gamma subunit